MTVSDRIGEEESGMEKALRDLPDGLDIELVSQELLFEALGKIVEKIEACGASTELTSAVCLVSDLRQAVGNQYNPANKYALKRVVDALSV